MCTKGLSSNGAAAKADEPGFAVLSVSEGLLGVTQLGVLL